MTEINTRERIAAAFFIFFVSALFMLRLPVLAEQLTQPPEDIRSLLEKSLSVVELDKEIVRIQAERQELLLTMTDTEKQLAIQEQSITAKREQAGGVLRAYYMGERDQLYSALLTTKSWTDFFRVLDYIDIIVSQDKHTLNEYIGQYDVMKEQFVQLEGKQKALANIEQKLHEQKTRVLALETQLAEQLNGRSDSEKIRLMIEELNTFWESKGLTEVTEYFKALSLAMGELPTWIQNNKDLLEIKGFQYTIRVPEDRLNDFLREQDERFNYFSFQFEDDKITAYGKRDDVEISISGQYSIENEPVNGIVFHVDELVFNGFILPDTTRSALEKEFDLGFYPGLILKMLKANSVEVKDGELIIKLSITL